MAKKPKIKNQVLFVKEIKQIAREYGSKKGPTELAEELGVSKQRIGQIATLLRKKGVKVPYMRIKLYSFVIEELKKENPELF